MYHAILLGCLPWLVLLVVLFICLRLLIRVEQARPRPGRLLSLHVDQSGSAQTLSFVLTLPFFVMIVLLILQVSQVMIGTVVVHYAAFAAARSAIVWIPARVGADSELENRISAYIIDPDAEDQVFPILDPDDENYGPAEGGVTYLVEPGGGKFEKISSAAVLACAPICPSRDLELDTREETASAAEIIKSVYDSLVPSSDLNERIPRRLENKLAYAKQSTKVEIRFFHPNSEPPLVTYFLPDDIGTFYFNELGWQDPITVTVTHQMALLPGPGRLLARPVRHPDGSYDETSQRIGRIGGVYVYPLTASITLGNEGEKSVIPHVHQIN